MSKKGGKGLSVEEKKKRMLDYFFETREVHSLKILEKVLPKEKGIVAMTVKEVLQMLVDDNLVLTDKIGAGNFFWALPGAAAKQTSERHAKVQQELAAIRARAQDLAERKKRAREGREESSERTEKLARLSALRAQIVDVDKEVAKFAHCDPERLSQLDKAVDVCKQAANRWTDAIFTLKSFFKDRSGGMSDAEFFSHFDLPESFDYVE